MFHRSIVLLAAASAVALAFGVPTTVSAAGAPAFEPMAFLAGHCWRGTFHDRPGVTDEHCFEWVFDGKFIRDRHVVRGDAQPYEGETLYAWDPESARIVYWYIARPGFHSTGHVESRDGELQFVDTLRQRSGNRDLRSVWIRTGADSFSVRTEDRTGGAVKELWSMEMRRVVEPGGAR